MTIKETRECNGNVKPFIERKPIKINDKVIANVKSGQFVLEMIQAINHIKRNTNYSKLRVKCENPDLDNWATIKRSTLELN